MIAGKTRRVNNGIKERTMETKIFITVSTCMKLLSLQENNEDDFNGYEKAYRAQNDFG